MEGDGGRSGDLHSVLSFGFVNLDFSRLNERNLLKMVSCAVIVRFLVKKCYRRWFWTKKLGGYFG